MVRVRYLTGRRVPLAAISPLHPAMEFAVEQAWIVYKHFLGRDPIVTGAQEDAHAGGSLHYGAFPDPRLRALDFDDDGITSEGKADIGAELKKRLGSQFDVIWESDHLHIEYDVRYF